MDKLNKYEMKILKKMYEQDSKTTLQELIRKCSMRKHDVVRHLNSLYNMGLVDKDDEDHYWITSSGRLLYEKYIKEEMEVPPYVDDILYLLANSSGVLQRVELARMLKVSPSNLTYSLKYLLDNGYVSQSEHERGKQEPYFITSKGLERLNNIINTPPTPCQCPQKKRLNYNL